MTNKTRRRSSLALGVFAMLTTLLMLYTMGESLRQGQWGWAVLFFVLLLLNGSLALDSYRSWQGVRKIGIGWWVEYGDDFNIQGPFTSYKAAKEWRKGYNDGVRTRPREWVG